MLQKIFVVLLGFIVSIVGALAPSGLFASTSTDMELSFQGSVREETLATVDADGAAFARVPVLWIEVDGRRVTEDAWGTGDLKELRFKVGVKDVEGTALLIGERLVELNPTDVLTVRMFRGDFAYRDVSLAGATLQLQGAVKTTMLSQGDTGTKVRTELGGVADGTLARGSDDGRLAYVVLDTGKSVDTVALEEGGRRLFTEEATSAANAKQQPGNLLAKWVKINGKAVTEYTWGEGSVELIEFEPAAKGSGTVVVAFDETPSEALAGQRVHVEEFIGTYTAFPVSGGYVRLGLDGYAARYSLGGVDDLPGLPGSGGTAPVAAFDYFPPNPRTTDTIRFTDRSSDDGVILFTMWDFAGESTNILPDTTYRFKQPGTYPVTLKVTDDDLHTTTFTRNITVRNADPIPDFDFSPKIVTSDTLVSFTDRSSDPDNEVKEWFWDFGDGRTDTARNPTHRFGAPGEARVTLTVKDSAGASASTTKIILVQNAPPLASFNFTPAEPQSGVTVTFLDESTDRDGEIAQRIWDFGDGNNGTGSSPTHSYKRPGVYTVTLTAIDDAGGKDSTSSQIRVTNRPAIVDFTYTPTTPSASAPVTFTSLAEDVDGSILYHEWRFSHTPGTSIGASTTQTFPSAGDYWVNHTVVDSSAETSWLNTTFTVDNTAPRVRLTVNNNPGIRGIPMQFTDLSSDPDGDPVVSWVWDFGDGLGSTERNPVHTYSSLGTFPVTLTVTDSQGEGASASFPITIQNARPVIDSLTIQPRSVMAGQLMWLNASASDLDLRVGDELDYEWRFSDGTVLNGPNVSRSFPSNGDYTVTLVVRDIEGGTSSPRTETLRIDYANPLAAFTFSPTTPATNQDVRFTDLSTSPNGAIVSRTWQFGDGTTSNAENPVHRYTERGEKTVRLIVTDQVGKQGVTEMIISVNERPMARFSMDQRGTIPINTPVSFTDYSSDVDGFIDTWRWEFGDGIVETYDTPTNPVHAYSTPGTKTIRLTVTDNVGADHTYEQHLSIENRRPVARWSAHAPAFLVNQDITFTSSSYDPDGTELKVWEWTFGDGRSSTQDNTTHRFLESGEYIVSLRVSDGQLQSLLDSDSYRFVRIGGDHPLPVTVRALYPNGDVADLSEPDVSLRMDLVRSGRLISSYDKAQLVENGDAYTHTFATGEWARGDSVVITFRNTTWQMSSMTRAIEIDTDALSQITHVFNLVEPMSAGISVKPSERGILLSEGQERTADGTPVYTDPTETIRGEGAVLFQHGVPASNAFVRVEMRHVPLSLFGQALSGDGSALSAAMGWCTVDAPTTKADGKFTWSARQSLCRSDALPLLPGLYEVRAVVKYPGALSVTTESVRFIVDPTGAAVELLEQR